jgi:hypothetical protein
VWKLHVKGAQEVSDFIFYFGRVRNRLGYLLPQPLLELAAQPVNSHADSALGAGDIPRHSRVSSGGRAAEQAGFERFEFGCLRRRFPFPAHLRQRLFYNGKRPPSFEECLRSFLVRRFKLIPSLRTVKLKGEWKHSPTPLQCRPVCEVVRKVVLQGRQKESPETAAFFSKRIEVAALDQESKEALSEVSRIVGCRTATPDIRIQGIPVGLTQLRQCGSRGGISGSSRIHDAPTSGLESQIEHLLAFARSE